MEENSFRKKSINNYFLSDQDIDADGADSKFIFLHTIFNLSAQKKRLFWFRGRP